MSKFSDKLKKINAKKAIKWFTLGFFLLLIVLASVASWGFNEEFVLLEWISNSILLTGISIFGILMGESIGTDKQMEMIGGLFQRNLKEYEDNLSVIETIKIYFSQFLLWFEKRELLNKQIRYLQNTGKISKAELVLEYIKIEDLDELAKHPLEKTNHKGVAIYFDQMSEEQIKAIRFVMDGKITMDVPNANFYLDAFENSDCDSVLEQGKTIDRDIRSNKKFNRTFKIITALIVSLIWALMTAKEFMAGNDMGAWINLVARISALLAGMLSGWLTSITDVKLKAAKLKNKTTVLKTFKSSFDKQVFIPLDENELAKKHYEEYIANVKVESPKQAELVVAE